jgi:GntR family transcriptional regulator
MNIYVDFRSGIPIYAQVVEQIKHLLAIGTLRPGAQLPPLRKLASDLDVNFNTIARAYHILEDEGIITTQHGRGTYVLEYASSVEPGGTRQEMLDGLTQRFIDEAKQMGFKKKEIEVTFSDHIASLDSGEQP